MTDRSSPIFFVRVKPEGKAAERLDLTERVLSFEYHDSESKADKLTLTINNWDLSNFDDPVWKAGNKLIVSWGYPGHMAPSRECIIQKVTGGQVLKVEALDRVILMNKEVRNRIFKGLTRSQAVQKVAEAYGFDAHDIEPTDHAFEAISQARQTDAQFIKRLADLEGFEFFVDFDGFHWHARRLGQKPLRVVQWYLPPDVGDIMVFNVENDIFAKPGKVTKKGRDPLNKKDVKGTASDADTKRDALAPVQAVAFAVDTGVPFVKNVESAHTAPTTETNDKQAKREADGKFRKAVQVAVKLTMEMVGDPGVFAKSVLDVRGISKRLSGLYYVNDAVHRIDANGYRLKMKMTTDGTHGRPLNLLDVPAKKPKSKAKVNEKKGEAAKDPGKLAAVKVDHADGTRTVYKDQGGKESKGVK